MKGKRICAWAVLLALVPGLLGCSGGGAGNGGERPEVTLTIKVPTLGMNCLSDPSVTDAREFMELAGEKFSQAYQDARVTVRVEVFDYVDEKDAIIGCYGKEDAADLLYEGYFNMAAYVSGGHVVPLDDIISDALREDISENSWAQSMKNGKTYMMPYLSMQNILIYNKELFRSCGLEQFITEEETIQDWTVQEWETVLDTLAAKLPAGSYPMMMYGLNNQGDTHIMSLIRAFGGEIFDEEGNFDFESEGCLRALEWLQGGVERGWYPPHPENIELADNHQLFINGQLGIYIFNNANFVLYDGKMENYGYVNFPGNVATSFITGFAVFDNGDEAKVRAAKELVKFIYEDEDLLELSAGNIPESKRVAGKYGSQIRMLPEFTANAVHVVDFMNSSPNWQGQDDSVRSVFYPHISDLLSGRVTPLECARGLDRDCNAAIHVEVTLHD